MDKNPNAKLDEDWKNFPGTTVFNIPFPKYWTDAQLKDMQPIIFKFPYEITYFNSYGQDSPWFAALANGVLLGTRCTQCGFTTANPKLSCQECYSEKSTEWVELPKTGKVHAFTVCYFGAEKFLDQTPFILALIEFEGVDTLLLSRLLGLNPKQATLDWIGLEVKAKFVKLSQLKPTDVYFVPV
jgi:uncharacterized OB-fold protein